MRRWFVGVAAAALIGLLSEPCLACDCAQPDPAERRDVADVIFTGEVVDFRSWWKIPLSEATAQELLDPSFSFHFDSVAFNVDRVFKGRVHQTQWLAGQSLSASCGFEFQLGRTYTVFASEDKRGQLQTGLCKGVFESSFDPAAFGLGSSHEPRPGTDVNDVQGYARWFLAFAVPASLAILFFSGRKLFRWIAPKIRRA